MLKSDARRPSCGALLSAGNLRPEAHVTVVRIACNHLHVGMNKMIVEWPIKAGYSAHWVCRTFINLCRRWRRQYPRWSFKFMNRVLWHDNNATLISLRYTLRVESIIIIPKIPLHKSCDFSACFGVSTCTYIPNLIDT